MLKALEDVSSTKKRLTIEIPAEAVESEIQKALTDVQRNTKIPGFRPGKAPLSLIEKRFGKNVEAEVLEKIVPRYYAMALSERNLKPVSGPMVEEGPDFKRNAPLSLTVMVEVRPEVEALKYDTLVVKETPVAITEDEVTKVMQDIAEERASYEPVDQEVQQGDLVTVDYDREESGTSARGVVIKVGSGPYPEEFSHSLGLALLAGSGGADLGRNLLAEARRGPFSPPPANKRGERALVRAQESEGCLGGGSR